MAPKAEADRERLVRLLSRRAGGEATYPLSWAQERMWFLAQLEPDSGAYTIASASRSRVLFDPEVLEASFSEIVRRHHALRTVFPVVDGRPVQRVLPELRVPVRTSDLSSRPPAEAEAEASRLAGEEAAAPFDLAAGPLLRVSLVRVTPAETLLLITLHHIVIDGWSFDILLRELTETYRAFALGLRPSLPELTVQYPDWSQWQRRWLSDERLESQLAYWRAALEGAPALIDLPADRPRPARKSGRGAVHPAELPEAVAGPLLALGRQEEATPFMTVLAGFVVLLYRWSGEADLVVGTPVANRPRAELHELIGLFLNTLALRVRCGSGVTFRDMLGRARDATLEALAHQDLPFERLVQDLAPVRDLSHSPLFQTMFVLRSAAPGQAPSAIAALPPAMSTSKFDLSVNAYETGTTVHLLWQYSTDLFDAGSIAELAGQFPRLLRAACAEPDRPVDELAGTALEGRRSGRGRERVVVRGFRIDPAAVAAAIARHPLVDEVEVVAAEDAAGALELVAHLSPAPGARPAVEDVRRAAAAELPAHMLPARFVLDGPASALTGAPPPGGVAAGDEEVHARLAAIWSQVLGRRGIGSHDNFFELGGHSLSAGQLVARIRDAFEVELPLRAVFEAPTIAELAAHLPDGRALSGPPLAVVPRGGPLPLSFAQERLWFLAQLQPGSAAYNVPTARWLDGPADAPALERALAEVLRRHEVLRTSFPAVDGRPVQRVHASVDVPVPLADLAHLPPEEALAEARRLSRIEADAPFDLAAGPLVRARLLRMPARGHLLLLTVHHIVVDGWSMDVLFGELQELHDALSRQRGPTLSELPLQYADFAQWQRRWLAGQRLESLLAYWREALAGAPAAIDLPTDRPRRPDPEPRGDARAFWLPAELRARVRQVSREQDATPFMTILVALALVLQRWTGQSDLVVGSPVACRPRAVLERLVGLFVNTVPLRVRIGPRDTFRSLLATVRRTTLDAFAHQDLPFEKLVEELQPERNLSRNPVFQVMLAVQNTPGSGPGSGRVGQAAQPGPPPGGATKFDLSLFVTDAGDRLQVGVEYAADLFERATIERFGQRFTCMLEAALSDLDAPVDTLPGTAGDEAQQLLRWSTGEGRAPCTGVLERVLAQAGSTPDALAVAAGAQTWSYAELLERARAVAGALRPHVVPDEPVGLCTGRTPAGLAALLGILLSGAPYLPLDPEYPRERLRLMIADARPAVVVTDRVGRAVVPAGVRVHDLGAHEAGSPPSPPCPAPPAGEPHPDRLAYVLYTSGSTGVPRGVAMTHGTLAGLVGWQIRRSGLPPGAATAQFAPWSFDVSAQEIFSTLGSGGVLVLVDGDTRRDPSLLWQLVASARIRRLFLPPVALQSFAEAAPAQLPAGLCELVAAGEQLVVGDALSRLLARSGVRLYNQYGPAETHVVTEQLVTEADHPLPPVGVPVAGAAAYVLDERLRFAPVGVPGDLHLGGALSRGYLGLPGATAERYVPDPFAATAAGGGRLYRTGDRCRWRSGGVLEFLGRSDDQLKVRGFRIEPGEVEAALERHPGVAGAVVCARGEGARRTLCASVVPRAGAELDVTELRAQLRSLLPEHLVPSLVLVVERFPTTPSGKVDRRAVSAAAAAAAVPAAGAGRTAPRTPVELAVAAIWAEVLDVPEVGLHDDFFDLGGHSLLATQVMSRIASRLGVQVPLRTLFEQPSVAALAIAVVSAQLESQGGSPWAT